MTESIGFGSARRLAAELLGRRTVAGDGENRNGVDVAGLGAAEKLRQFLPAGNSDLAATAATAETAEGAGVKTSGAAAFSSAALAALQALDEAAEPGLDEADDAEPLAERALARRLKAHAAETATAETGALAELGTTAAGLARLAAGQAAAAYGLGAGTALTSTLGLSL